MSKYHKGKLPLFTPSQKEQAVRDGSIRDDEGNLWRFIKSSFGKPELYCRELHLSYPLYKKEQIPIDPLVRKGLR